MLLYTNFVDQNYVWWLDVSTICRLHLLVFCKMYKPNVCML